MAKLCQIIAIISSRKSTVQKEVTELHHKAAKEALLTGISRTYTPKDESGEKQPPENKSVQLKAMDAVQSASRAWTSLFDVVATQDFANCQAKADVKVGDLPLVKDCPVTHLLFLEKQLQDIHTFIEKLPTLDPAQNWVYDENKGCFRTEPVEQLRTQKVQEPLVLYHATKEHPAQTQVVSKDVVAGTWTTTHFSGAIPADRKLEMLERVVKVQEAVKFAREQANQIDVQDKSIGKEIFDFILGPKRAG